MKKVFITVVVTLVILAGGFLIFIFSGSYNISQLSHHNKLTLAIIKTTTHHSVEKRLKGIVVPDNLKDSAMLITGFQHYNEMCAMCHAAPGQEPNEMAKGLYPKPPELYKYAGENDAREFFWIIKNGIKMTSMPAFEPTHDDQKIWAMDAFVTQKLGKMSPEEYQAWLKKYGGKNTEDPGTENAR